jgi:hypothetical protein
MQRHFIVGQASRLPSKNFQPQAGRLRYMQSLFTIL